jgi:para-aminobenzoate synthetase component 1
LRLREIAAAPYSAYVEYENNAVLCLSPERFISANGRELLTQPIKGTAPRDSDATRDHQLAQQLQSSEKNRAENLMIVDLLRNDLGRSCKPGSIRVEQLFELQSFATVHHLVSSIRGELRDDLHAIDALKNCFPGGSITGAPKHRAMQIIDELEPNARSIFCGAIGYIDVNGNMDSNITIRTLLAQNTFSQKRQTEKTYSEQQTSHDQRIYAWAGGGVVADSNSDEELQETNNKIDALLNALAEISTK